MLQGLQALDNALVSVEMMASPVGINKVGDGQRRGAGRVERRRFASMFSIHGSASMHPCQPPAERRRPSALLGVGVSSIVIDTSVPSGSRYVRAPPACPPSHGRESCHSSWLSFGFLVCCWLHIPSSIRDAGDRGSRGTVLGTESKRGLVHDGTQTAFR
jgi:hypothetical protein